MTDTQEEFENLLKTPAPPVREDAKRAAIERAMGAFDQHFSQTRQGSPKGNRLMEALRAIHNSFLGGHPMQKTRIIGGLATIAIGIALLNSSSLTSLLPQEANKGTRPLETVTTAAAQHQAMQSPQTVPAPALAVPAPKDTYATGISGKLDSLNGSNEKEERKALAANEPMLKNKEVAPQKKVAERVASSLSAASIAPGELPAAPASAPVPMGGSLQQAYRGISADAAKSANMIAPAPGVYYPQPIIVQEQSNDKFEQLKDNPVKATREEPVSTFSLDVDTSSYSFLRATLNNNYTLPPKDAVRAEEFINYFPYEYESPESKATPFKASVSVMPTPWNKNTKLIHIGIKGYQLSTKEKTHANLVFLIDTSGSMNDAKKLPLLVSSMKMLLDSLNPEDTVGIVTYAGYSGVALEPTKVKDKARILSVLDSLYAGGSTAGSEGIRTAYQLAERNFDKEGINRVILSTDGDFNVGITSQDDLKKFIEHERDTGIYLSVLGFGMGNYNDATMQALARNGNGNAAYIDNLSEARKALVEEASSTLFTIAKDVKVQVEFNPAKVAEYRLIGYEKRLLNREDFNNDKVDAGDIGSGHTVTALYEITPVGAETKQIDDLRYGAPAKKEETKPEPGEHGNEYAFVKIRYKLPEETTSKLITTAVDEKVEFKTLDTVPQEARFAASVAAFAELLRGDTHMNSFSYKDVAELAQGAKGADNFGYRAEFINLVKIAEHAAGQSQPQPVPAPGVYNPAPGYIPSQPIN